MMPRATAARPEGTGTSTHTGITVPHESTTGGTRVATDTEVTTTVGEDYSFTVSPSEIDRFVEDVTSLRDTMARYAEDLAGLKLDDGVFGRLPGISSKLYDAYDHHTEQCTQAFAEGRDVLDRLGARAHDAADSYRNTDTGNVRLVRAMARQIPLKAA